MKLLMNVSMALVLCLLTVTGVANDIKIGVIDLNKVLQEAPQIKKVQAKLEKEFKSRQKAILAKQEAVQKAVAEFERDSAIMSDREKVQSEEKIRRQQRDLQRDMQDYQQDLNQAQGHEMQEFLEEIKKAVEKVAKKENYHIILQKDVVPYADPTFELTKKVLDELS